MPDEALARETGLNADTIAKNRHQMGLASPYRPAPIPEAAIALLGKMTDQEIGLVARAGQPDDGLAYPATRVTLTRTNTEVTCMAEHTDTERLNWVLLKEPEFEDGFLRVWMGPMAAEDAGLKPVGGYYVADGGTQRECIDNAMTGRLRLVE